MGTFVTGRDEASEPILHRSIAVEAAGASNETPSVSGATLSALLGEDGGGSRNYGGAKVNKVLNTKGAQTIELRFWMGADDGGDPENADFKITVVAWPARSKGAGTNPSNSLPKGRVLLKDFLITAGASETEDINPVTGEAAAGIDFHECDTITDTSAVAYTSYEIHDETGGADGQVVLVFDPMGFPKCHVFVHDIDTDFDDLTTPKILIAARKVG